MKLLLAVGFDGVGIARALEFAERLANHGLDAYLLVGEHGVGEARIERDGRLVKVVRTDPAPGHWQRSRSIDVARLVRTVIAELRVDLLLVRDRRGLTHDLVATAASVSVPAIVEIENPSYACLVGDRIRRDLPGPCDAALGPMPCLMCAEADPAHGATPWVPIEARFLGAAERRRDALRELELAHAVLVRDQTAVEHARRALDSDLARVAWRVGLDTRDPAVIASVCREALAASHALEAPKPNEWWVDRMQSQAESAWDESFRRARSVAP